MVPILVVDDSGTVRDEVAGFLKRNGLDVATAVDGEAGHDKLRRDPKVKLVVSDLNMPNRDSLTMAERIRGELGNKAVNIVMLTTENSPIMKERRHQGLDREAFQGRRRPGHLQEAGQSLNARSTNGMRHPQRALERQTTSSPVIGHWVACPSPFSSPFKPR